LGPREDGELGGGEELLADNVGGADYGEEEEEIMEGSASDGVAVVNTGGFESGEGEMRHLDEDPTENSSSEEEGGVGGVERKGGFGQHVWQVGEGVWASKCPVEWDAAERSLLWALESPKNGKQSWWIGRQEFTLRAAVKAIEAFQLGKKTLELAEAWEILETERDRGKPDPRERAYRTSDRSNVIRAFLGTGPFLAVVTAGDENRGAFWTILLPRSGDVSVLAELHIQVKASVEASVTARLARIAGLPLKRLQQLAGSTEAKKVLNVALSKVVGKKALARHSEVDVRTLRAQAKQVDVALSRLAEVLAGVVKSIEVERIS
jgi:hypothetical protein